MLVFNFSNIIAIIKLTDILSKEKKSGNADGDMDELDVDKSLLSSN